MGYKKKEELFLYTLIISLFFLSFASAEIYISHTGSTYNFGDELNFSISIFSQSYKSNFLKASIICPTEEIEIYRAPYTLLPGGQKEIYISANLGNFLLSKGGQCRIKAVYSGEESTSQEFEISRDLFLTFNINKAIFSPGEEINVTGQAIKLDGTFVNGFIEVSFSEINFSLFNQVNSGQFNFKFKLPENIKGGTYSIKARVYEKDSFGEITNEKTEKVTIKIKKVIKTLEIVFDKDTIYPRGNLSYSVSAYDQAKEPTDSDIALTFYKPDNTVFKKEIIKSGETKTLKIDSNLPPGNWRIEAKLNELYVTRTFFIEELKELKFELENNTLIITNTGNVPYNGPVEIIIGGKSEIREIKNLAVGASKRFKLLAPNGEYEIKTLVGQEVNDLGTTFLTGRAISVSDVTAGSYYDIFNILWIVLILIILAAGFYLFRKIAKKKFVGKISKKVKTPQTFLPADSAKSNSSLIERGQKQESSIVSLKIKNLETLRDSPALDAIDSSLWKAKESGAKVYADGNYRIIILAEVLTKEKDNSLKAIALAQDIERIFASYNKRHVQQIDFGIGVNTGNLLVETAEGKFRFVSLDNVLSITKKISEQANSEVLISEETRRKVIGKAKLKKIPEKNFWKIERIVDRTMHADFINKFKQRNR